MVKAIARETRFTNAIDGNRATMLLYDAVGIDESGSGIPGGLFADEMMYHKSLGRSITVYINSPGGIVFDGFSIIQAILDCKANTHIVGMAASMAGVISQFGDIRTCNDFSVGMIHGVSGKGKLSDILNEQLKDCLMKRSKIKEKDIDEMMSTTSPTWLDSSQMWSMGLIDEKPVQTGTKIKNSPELGNLVSNWELYTTAVNKLTPTPKKMELTHITAALGVDEANIVNKITDLKAEAAKVAELTNKVATLESEKAELQKAITENTKTRATDMVTNAIKAGKVKEEAKQEFIDFAVYNYDGAVKAIEALAPKRQSVTNYIDPKAAAESAASATNAADDYEHLAKNDPKKLQEIFDTDPERYAKIENAYIAKNKK